MIDASTIKLIQAERAEELHIQLRAKIEHAVVNAAMDSRTELLVQLHTAMQLPPDANVASIRLEAYAYDIERLQFGLKLAGYKVDNTTYTDSFIIKW